MQKHYQNIEFLNFMPILKNRGVQALRALDPLHKVCRPSLAFSGHPRTQATPKLSYPYPLNMYVHQMYF